MKCIEVKLNTIKRGEKIYLTAQQHNQWID